MRVKKLLLPLVFISSIVAHEPPTMLNEHSVDISYTTADGQTKKSDYIQRLRLAVPTDTF